jgi:hypothetical protein
MRKALASLAVLLAIPSLAAAGGVEISGFAGYTFPFYSQTFTYQHDPSSITVPIPGLSIQQKGAFELNASGGLAAGGSITLYASSGIGLEFRVDSASIKVESKPATFDVNVALPAPLDPVKSTLTLDAGTVELNSGLPLSLNLKLRTGKSGLFLSGGVSRLGDMSFRLEQPIAIGVTAVNLQTGNLEIATVNLKATPAQTGSSWGGNLGIGVQIPLGEHGGLVFEGRGFYFPKQTIEWQPEIDTPLGPIASELLNRVLDNLQPVEFKPWWVQATIGISYRF